jgi:chromate transporter
MQSNPSPPPLDGLTKVYLKAGNTTFGGGDPTIAVLQRELLERKQWLSEEQFAIAYSLARITPGTNVLAFCAASAWMLRGWMGAAAAVFAASAPSSLLAVWLTVAFEASTQYRLAQAIAGSVQAAVVGIMAASALLLVKPQLAARSWPRLLLLTGGTLALHDAAGFSPLTVIVLAAVAGWFWKEPDPA